MGRCLRGGEWGFGCCRDMASRRRLVARLLYVGASLTVTREARAQIGRGGGGTRQRTGPTPAILRMRANGKTVPTARKARSVGHWNLPLKHAQPDLPRPWWELYRAVTQPASARRQRRVHRVNDPRGKKCFLRGGLSTSFVIHLFHRGRRSTVLCHSHVSRRYRG